MSFFAYVTHINCHLSSCRILNDNKLEMLPSGIFSDLTSLRVFQVNDIFLCL